MNSLQEKLNKIIFFKENGFLTKENLNVLEKEMDLMIEEVIKKHKDKISFDDEIIDPVSSQSNLLKIKEASENLLLKENLELLQPIIFNQYDPKNNLRRLNLNSLILSNLTRKNGEDNSSKKLLFFHWKMNAKGLSFDFRFKDFVWDYYITHNINCIFRVTVLGMDVPDDFPDFPIHFPEPQKTYFHSLFYSPFQEPIFVFFVNRKNIFYLKDANIIDYPKFNTCEDIESFKVEITNYILNEKLKYDFKNNVEKQILMLSDLIETKMS